MALTIVVRGAGTEPAPQITFDAPRIVIGRGDGCEVRLPDPSVSHRHASVRQRGAEYIVLDEGSTNGTFVGPVRLSPQAPRVLKDGDLIRVGRVWLEARIEQAPPTQNTPIATKELALGLIARALASQGESPVLRVRVAEGTHAGKELGLERFDVAYVVGRGATADLSLDDPDLSRRHVEITRRGERLLVKDLGSKNGTRLGEQPLPPNQEAPWPVGVHLVIGAQRLLFDDPVRDALEELERAADERLRDEEFFAAPVAPAEENPMVHEPEPGAASRSAPARNPRKSRRSGRSAGAGTTWTATDILVAFIALVVLALSLGGLVWLIGSGS